METCAVLLFEAINKAGLQEINVFPRYRNFLFWFFKAINEAK